MKKREGDTSIKDVIAHWAYWTGLFLGWYWDDWQGKTVCFPVEGHNWNGNYMRKCASGGQSLTNAERGVGSGYEWICRQDRGLKRLRPHWDQGRVLHFGLETGCDYTTIVRW